MKNNKVIDRQKELFLENCSTKISEYGRNKVLKEKRKNVHSFIIGDLISRNENNNIQISYNPYKFPYFYDVKTLEEIKLFKTAHLYIENDKPIIKINI